MLRVLSLPLGVRFLIAWMLVGAAPSIAAAAFIPQGGTINFARHTAGFGDLEHFVDTALPFGAVAAPQSSVLTDGTNSSTAVYGASWFNYGVANAAGMGVSQFAPDAPGHSDAALQVIAGASWQDNGDGTPVGAPRLDLTISGFISAGGAAAYVGQITLTIVTLGLHTVDSVGFVPLFQFTDPDGGPFEFHFSEVGPDMIDAPPHSTLHIGFHHLFFALNDSGESGISIDNFDLRFEPQLASPVPEPSTLALAGVGALSCVIRKLRRRRHIR